MSEERYVKQIVSDVMEMAAKIKFLEAKVAASESWNAECVADHDAALRRAKAEGMREIRQLRRHLRVALDHAEQHHEGCLYCGEGEIVDGDTTPAHRAKCWYYKASRAAQIEEGDK